MTKKMLLLLLLALTALLLAACSKKSETLETQDEAAISDQSAATAQTLAAAEASSSESPYYGLIYATVIDINGSGDSSTVYTFSDKDDPYDSWSCPRHELRDVETDINVGDDVVVCFNGDIAGDYDNVSFLVVLPFGDYEIRRAEGVTTGNLMSTFSIETADGEQISFLKDNAITDDGALSADSGDKVIVYYADGGEEGRFPLRVFKAG